MRFLDVAAGSGALSIPAARLGAPVLAIDLSPAMLDLLDRAPATRTEHRDAGHGRPRARLEDEASTCRVAVRRMLFPDMPKGIGEMASVVRPGGRVLVTVYGNPHGIEFLGFFVAAVQAGVPRSRARHGPAAAAVPAPGS